MANPNLDEPDEAPLDPAMARVQAKLRRLLLIAGLTLGIGMLAVFAGILYRLSTFGDRAPDMPAAATVAEATVPAGARLVASAFDGGRIVLTYEHPGGTTLILVDAKSLKVAGRLDLKPAAP